MTAVNGDGDAARAEAHVFLEVYPNVTEKSMVASSSSESEGEEDRGIQWFHNQVCSVGLGSFVVPQEAQAHTCTHKNTHTHTTDDMAR